MKTERRHELQTNVLADWIGIQIERFRPYSRLVLGVVVAIVVAIGLYGYLNTQAGYRNEEGWQRYFIAMDDLQQKGDIEPLTQVAQSSEFTNTPVGYWAVLSLADHHLREGIGKKMRSLLRQEHFDVVHIQSIHHTLTSSILLAAKQANLPVVWTLHDYRLICPESHLLRKGENCELCVKGSLIHAITNRCKRGSIVLSTGAVIASLADRIARIREIPNKFIAPSDAVLRRFVSAGFDESRITVVHHFVEVPQLKSAQREEKGILYFGRFSREKGIRVMLKTSLLLRDLPFQFVGEGEMRREIEDFCVSHHSNNVAVYPFMNSDQLQEMILNAQVVVCPSQWAEVFGLTILESMALGKIVIASAVGAIPEIIQHGENGFLVKKISDPREWANAIETVLTSSDSCRAIKENAIESVRVRFSRDAHYLKLIRVYESVVNQN